MRNIFHILAICITCMLACVPSAKGEEIALADAAKSQAKASSQLVSDKSLSDNRMRSQATAHEDEPIWSEWTTEGTMSIPEECIDNIRTRIQNLGDEFTEWEQPFTVMRRHDTSDPDKIQFKFCKIFNNVDYIVNYNSATSFFYASGQPTGIRIGNDYGPDTYESYLFACNGNYYEYSHTFEFNYTFMYVYGNMGLECGFMRATMDGHTPIFFSCEAPDYYPSSATEATIKINSTCSEEAIKTYRVAVFGDHPGIGLRPQEEINELMAYSPADTEIAYTDYTSPVFKIDLTGVVTYVTVILFDKNNKVATSSGRMILYHNQPLEGEWLPLGKGKLREMLSYRGLSWNDRSVYYTDEGLFAGSPVESEVEIEHLAGNPDMMRVKNPFGAGNPFHDKFNPLDETDNYYMVFDVADPSNVKIENTISGIRDLYFYDPIVFMQPNYPQPEYSGKYADKKITLPHSSINMEVYDDKMHNQIELELPGYVDYTMEWSLDGCPIQTEENVWVRVWGISSNLRGVKYALVAESIIEQNRFTPEKLGKMVAEASVENGEAKMVYTEGATDAILSFPMNEITSIPSAFVATGIDYDGNYHLTLISKGGVVRETPLEEWNKLGVANITENVMLSCSTMANTVNFSAEVREHPEVAGLYCLINPWKEWVETTGLTNIYDHTTDHHLFINTTEGHEIYITDQLSGSRPKSRINTTVGMFMDYDPIHILGMEDNAILYGEQYSGTPTCGTDADGNKIIDLGSAVMIWIPQNGEWLGPWSDDTFLITIPAPASINEIADDDEENGPVEYYNLQGIRVDNPSEGIFIRRQGNTVSKTVVR